MKDNINQDLPNSSGRNKGKNTNNGINSSTTGLQIFNEYFSTRIGTVYQFEKATGISRADGCRYKRTLEKLGKLQVVKTGKCPISRENGVQKLTTNSKWFTDDMQLPIPFNPPNQ